MTRRHPGITKRLDAEGVLYLVEKAAMRLLGDFTAQRFRQLNEEFSLLVVQLLGNDHLDGDQLVAAVAAAQIGHAFAAQAELLAGLGSGRDLETDGTIER